MVHALKDYITQISSWQSTISIEDFLLELTKNFPGQVTFSTSFGFEDQVISHIILSNNIPISIFTLDTGRLFPETYSVWNSTNQKYNTRIKAYYLIILCWRVLLLKRGQTLFMNQLKTEKDVATYGK